MRQWQRSALTVLGGLLLLWYLFVLLAPRGGHPHQRFEARARTALRQLGTVSQLGDPDRVETHRARLSPVQGEYARYVIRAEAAGGSFRFTAIPEPADYAPPLWRRMLLLDFQTWHYPVYTLDAADMVLRADGRVVEEF
jgi:hypothetical protein